VQSRRAEQTTGQKHSMTQLCAEMELCRAERDQVIFNDQRVMDNLLEAERHTMIRNDCFVHVQKDITSEMRRIVVNWMMEVCADVCCEKQVFPLAVQLMDQFLVRCNTARQHLQLLGAGCIRIASKVRQTQPVSTEELVYYTDNSITGANLMRVEIRVLVELKWYTSFVTAADFVEHILSRVPWAEESPLLRRHVYILMEMSCSDEEITRVRPSAVASGCLMAAARGLRITSILNVASHVCSLTHVTEADAIAVEERVEALVRVEEARHRVQQRTSPTSQPLKPNRDSGTPENGTYVSLILIIDNANFLIVIILLCLIIIRIFQAFFIIFV
jgi:hypothetical protein